MLNDNKVIGFVPTKDAERARRFYANVLGLRFVADDQFVTLLGWEVSQIEKVVSGLEKKGVVFERYGWFEQDKLGIWTAPGGAKVAWFKDPDGNLLSVSQHPE